MNLSFSRVPLLVWILIPTVLIIGLGVWFFSKSSMGNNPKKELSETISYKKKSDIINICQQEYIKEQQIKDVLLTASQRRRANKEISHLLKTFHGTRKLRELLRAMKQRGYPDYVLKIAIERVEAERKRDELTFEEIMDFEEFKASLDQQKQSHKASRLCSRTPVFFNCFISKPLIIYIIQTLHGYFKPHFNRQNNFFQSNKKGPNFYNGFLFFQNLGDG